MQNEKSRPAIKFKLNLTAFNARRSSTPLPSTATGAHSPRYATLGSSAREPRWPTSPEPGSHSPSIWRRFLRPNKNRDLAAAPEDVPQQDGVETAVQTSPEQPVSLHTPQAALSALLAREAQSRVMEKHSAQKTGSSPRGPSETNRTPGRGTGPEPDAQQSSYGGRTAVTEAECEQAAEDECGERARPKTRSVGARTTTTTTTDGNDSGWTSDVPRFSSGSRRRDSVGYKLLLRSKRQNNVRGQRKQHQRPQQQQQQHHHHHYHHDHLHRRWNTTGDLSLPLKSYDHVGCRDEPSACAAPAAAAGAAPTEYHHHHHHHHYHHHYYHFRGRPVKDPTVRPASYPQHSAETEKIEETHKYENNDSSSISIDFSNTPETHDTPYTPFLKTSRSISNFKNIFKKRKKSKVLSMQSPNEDGFDKLDSNLTFNSNLERAINEEKSSRVLNTQENVMFELARTEKEYVTNLGLMVNGYLEVMENPNATNAVAEDLKLYYEKYKLIFVNIKPIYEWHRDVCLPALERCQNEPNEFNELLKKTDEAINMYAIYCQKIHNFEYLDYEYENYSEETRNFLGPNLQIYSVMIMPLQRIVECNGLLKEMFKLLEQGKFKIDTKLSQNTIDRLNKIIQGFDEIRIASLANKRYTINSNYSESSTDNHSKTDIDENPRTKALRRREYVMNELIDTEENYVKYLDFLVNKYMIAMADPKKVNPEIIVPAKFQTKSSILDLVFVNVKQIYEWHRDIFLPTIKKCLAHPEVLQELFNNLYSNKQLYEIYSQNNTISSFLVSTHIDYFEEMRRSLGIDLDISSIMIKPVQRISKYELLLKEFLKHTEKAGLCDQTKPIQSAINTMSNLVRELDDKMIVGRLFNFDGDIKSQGELLIHGKMRCAETQNNVVTNPVSRLVYKDLYVFLFDKIMIFTTIEVTNKYEPLKPIYYYKDHILLNNMKLHDACNKNDGSFIISSDDSSKPTRQYICHPISDTLRFKWFEKLSSSRASQDDFIVRLMNPLG